MSRNKRKVSTKGLGAREKVNIILNLLKNNPEGLYPMNIAVYGGINHNTVKSILRNLLGKEVKQDIRGLYSLVEKDIHGKLFSWNFHNTNLKFHNPNYNGEKIKDKIKLGPIKAYFGIGKGTKNATLHISAEPPINISALSSICIIFKFLIKKHMGIELSDKDIWITTIEFNQDFENLRLDGPNCITFDSLYSQFKLYQKKLSLRKEIKIKSTVAAHDVIGLLIREYKNLDLYDRVSNIEKILENLPSSIKNIQELFKIIIEKLPEVKNANTNRS